MTLQARLGTERAGRRLVMPYIRKISEEGKYLVLPSIGEADRNKDTCRELQQYGDIFVQLGNGQMETIELKTEKENKYGNLFIVIWANKPRGTFEGRSGWLYTSKADVLLYTFLDTKEIFRANFKELKEWVEERKDEFEEKVNWKNTQHNIIVGRVIPIKRLLQEGILEQIPSPDLDS